MLKLICDIKCGYENLYIVEKDAAFPLDFLTNESLFKALFDQTKIKLPNEQELFAKYMNNPEGLVQDYGLFNVLRTIVGTEYSLKFFNTIKDKTHPFFPEFFRIENLKLIADLGVPTFEDMFNLNDGDKSNDDHNDDGGGTEYTA